LCAGLIKTKEELLGPATTDDEEDDEISDLIDTFRYFTEKPSDENYLDLLTYGNDLQLNAEIRALCQEFPEIFSGVLPKEPAKLSPFRIEVDRNKWEVSDTRLPPRTQTKVKNDEILKQTTELLNLGIIEHSQAGHYSQCLLAPKPHTNKTEWRFCIDYRFLNNLTAGISWPLPNIKHMFERLGAQKAKYFAVMDFTQGFHQIALDKASAVLTAFITFCGVYQFTRVPFGPKNAPSYYQQLIAGVVLAGILYLICELYIDDVIVFGKDKETFLANLRTVFERFKRYGIVLKPKKCKFGLTEIEYVGRIINQQGTTMRNETITKVLEFPLPVYFKQLRGFIGLVNYFRDHVYENHSAVVKPLQKLLEGMDNPTRKLDWTDEATSAFFKIKDLIAMQAALFFANDVDPIYLLTDASDYGIGGYLYQLVDGKELPIAFVSKSLTGAQLRWSTPQKEMYAIFYCVTHLSYLLRDRKFHLKTDHRNLTAMADSINAMIVRWKTALMQYDFDIEHIAGIKNVVADYLSRLVENHMANNKKFDQQLVLTAGFHGFIIPDEAHDKIIMVHNSLVGHAGVERCLKRLGDSKQTWRYMREHVRAFIKACACCQKMSALKIPIHGHHFTTSTYQPMVRLNIDFLGPFEDGGYILTIIDTFTRWVELYLCDRADADEAARSLLEHFGRFGAPSQILSDRGSHFVNHVITEFLSYVGTEHCLSIAYSKQENSLAERTNKEINRHMTSLFFDRKIKDNYRNAKPMIQRILNSNYSDRTKISPADMLFGKAVDLDRGIFAPFEESTSTSSIPLSQTTSKMLQLQKDLMRIHREILKKGDETHNTEDPDTEFTVFANDEYVLLEPVTGPKDRLHTRRTGPYRIIESNNNNYTLENLVSQKQLRVHINRLVPFLFDPKRTDPKKVAIHDADEFHIEMILSHRGRFTNKRQLEFKVRWTGFDETFDTWEPWKHLRDVTQLHDYLRLIKLPEQIPKNHQTLN
jgi:transposase InsO family protein